MINKMQGFRCDPETERMLTELCDIFHVIKSDMIRYCIRQQYDIVQGSPQARELVNLLQDFTAKVKAIGATQTLTDGTDKPV